MAFVAEEDLWITDLLGSTVYRLGCHGACQPLLSPGGDLLAFALASDLWVITLEDGHKRPVSFFLYQFSPSIFPQIA